MQTPAVLHSGPESISINHRINFSQVTECRKTKFSFDDILSNTVKTVTFSPCIDRLTSFNLVKISARYTSLSSHDEFVKQSDLQKAESMKTNRSQRSSKSLTRSLRRESRLTSVFRSAVCWAPNSSHKIFSSLG